MLKKLTALCVSVLMVMSLFAAVPVSASELPANIGTDYEPGEVTGNLLRDTEGNLVTGFSGSADAYSETTYNEENVFSVGHNRAIALSDTETAKRGAVGLAFPKAVLKDAYDAGGTWIFTCDVASTNAFQPKVNFGIFQQSYKAIRPLEYPSHNDGLEMKGYCNYQDFEATVVLPEQRNAIDYALIDFGFATSEENPKSLFIKKDTIYLGTEYAYDIDVTADATEIVAGGTVAVDADIYNQINKVGTLSQDVTWYALNDARTEAVDGFTFTEGKDGTATVSVASSVPAGEYTLVAVADADADLVKGIKVTVENIDLTTDYEPGEVTDNLFSEFSNQYAVSYSNNGTETTITNDGAIGDGVLSGQEPGAYGAGVSVTDSSFWAAGNTFVFSVNAKNNGGSPKLKLAVMQTGRDTVMPIGYSSITDGVEVTNTEYQKYSFTMTVPESYTDFGFCRMYLGFPETPAGETEASRSIKFENASAYLGLQYAYDIDVTADSTSLFPGKTIAVDADVLNQVGSKGTLSQGVTWVAMNADRTASVEGFTFVEATDGKATVSVDASVAPGTYALVAVADADSKLVKSIEITVPDITAVYTAGDAMEGNLIETESFTTNNGGVQAGEKADTKVWFGYYTGSGTPAQSSTVSGGHIPVGDSSTGLRGVAKSGDHIVFGAKVNRVYNTTTTLNAVFTAEGSTPSLYPIEYGEAGHDIPGGGYKQFGATYVLNDATTAGGNWHMRLHFGFVNGTTAESSPEMFYIERDSMYLGYERAYDLTTTVTGETTFTEGTGGTFTVAGKVVNQVGSVGTLGQGITWLVMNEAKTAFVSDVKAVENADDTVTVAVAEDAPVGTYKLVAIADDYSNIIKNIDIVVEEEVVPIEGITISATEGGITVATDTDLTDAQLIFVKYENGKMVAANIDRKVNLDAQNTQEYSIPAGFEAAKVMLFTADFKPLANVLN